MSGSCTFQLSGKVTYVMDKPSNYGGQIRVRIEVPTETIGTQTIPAHGIYLNVRYDTKDTSTPRFSTLKAQLQKGMFIFVRGNLKPSPATDKWPATHFLDASWRDAFISASPFPPRNKVFFEGDVCSVTSASFNAKYSYMNPKETDPAKKWNDRYFDICIAEPIAKNPRDPVFFEGRVFGVDPMTKKDVVWILADTVF